MSNNVLVELSDALADAAEKAGNVTVLVNAVVVCLPVGSFMCQI